MKGYTSFISEHTTEFILVPKLVNILNKQFSTVVPIFPWITREGANISKLIHKKDKFFVVGLFCKRPKINENEGQIFLKINGQFLEYAKIGSELNIPIVAGCPLVNNFWELNRNPNCVWVKLDDNTNEGYLLPSEKNKTEAYLKSNTKLFNSELDLLNFLVSNSKETDLEQFIESIRALKQNSEFRSFFGFGFYKPIFFLLRK